MAIRLARGIRRLRGADKREPISDPTDSPMTDPKDDALGRAIHAERLAKHLRAVGSPFVMCVSGEWGSGKTTFLHFLASKVKQLSKWDSQWVYPWRYDSPQDAQKALLTAVWGKLLTGTWQERLKQRWKRKWRLLVPTVFGLLAEGSGKARSSEVARLVELLTASDAPLTDQLHEQLEEECARYFEVHGRGKRLLFLIDDLDRCGEEIICAVLHSLHLHAQLPGLVFLVGADLDAITAALEQRGGRSLVEKFFQQVWWLPPPEPGKFKQFHKGLLNFVPEQWRPGEEIWGQAVEALGGNPRKIKRYVFSLCSGALAASATLKPNKDKLAGLVLLSHVLSPPLFAILCRAPSLLLTAQLEEDRAQAVVHPEALVKSGVPFFEEREMEAARAWLEPRLVEFVRALPKFKSEEEIRAYLRFSGLAPREETPEERTAALTRGLESEEAEVREAAAVALGQIRDPRVVDLLIERLHHKDPDIRSAAAGALGQIADKRAVEPLVECLHDKDADARRAAVFALGGIGDPRAVEPLIRVLHDEDSLVRTVAAVNLGRMGDARAVQPLLERLNDSSPAVRWRSALALGAIRDQGAVEPLLERLKDEDPLVRGLAAFALGGIGDEHAVEPLIERLKDDEPAARSAAASALGAIGNKRAVDPLLERLEDTDRSVRNAAIEALGMTADNRAVEPLIERLQDEHWSTRYAATEALGTIADPRAVEPLRNAAREDPDGMTRDAAQQALKRVWKRKAEST